MSENTENNIATQTAADPYKNEATLEQMKTMYTAANTDDERVQAVETLVKQLGKSKASVIGKLGSSSCGNCYKAKKRVTKTGGPIVRKWQLCDQIEQASKIGFTDAEIDSLGKATKNTLDKLLTRFDELNAELAEYKEEL